MKLVFCNTCLVFVLAFLEQPNSTEAFSTIGTQTALFKSVQKSHLVLFSSEEDSSNEIGNIPEGLPPPPMNAPPPVPPKRMDPLMASLTRMDPETASGPTQNIPIFGEVPVDGSMVVLVPAAVIAFLGFVLSIVVAVQSQDQLIDALSSVADDISKTATEKTNMMYDEDVCRGICSTQEEDLDGLRSFMESLRK